ncbi:MULTISPECIES: type 1 glutamine amidotransferase domain-containing protein [Sphingobacterium]|jgi:putative intracellular protease/amidase|uniref:type 1 glutamine amidotransferase domain-containing protein n=1 Tax=Sphingobacterium TaxID=28453 RepID=UPI000DFE1B7C|nr:MULTISPECIES: type 1 glutamine amidotransferase domain-containing protein [Sphingobacterium]QQT46803.1 type 1 glutamine amidotransferase domain-containing protein [Sphingobacterium multivorum]SUJ88962.1 Molecular chaperone Hsp31 and glyoxalase 3 [Sphingobacterium multivorum]
MKKDKLKVLVVLTSHDQLGDTGEKTGFWVEEFAAPYYVLQDAGVDVTIASPKGGQPPIDPKSVLPDFQTEATKRFDADKELQTKLANSLALDTINEQDYDAIFYPGGHGPLWDLTNDKTSVALIESFWAHNKPVAAVCHAPAVFRYVKDSNGQPLVKGKKVTGFSNSEEEAVQLTAVVPFLVEDELVKLGAQYSKGEDWHSYVVKDGHLITGQNPASSEETAKALFTLLSNSQQ